VCRTAQRQVSFADWELTRQGLRFERLLQAISDFLENQKDVIELRCDLTRGLKKPETGRSGLKPHQSQGDVDMTEPTTDDDEDLSFLDTPLTLQDWIGIIGDDIDEAVEGLNSNEVDKLCEFLRSKLDDIELPF
jgi:hypothetical protein